VKLSGGRVDAYLKAPDPSHVGALFFGPDQGLCAERAGILAQAFCQNPDDPFAATSLNADDLTGDPARLVDEMSALSLLGDARLIHIRLSHERGGAAIAKTITMLDGNLDRCAAKLIIEAGDLSPRSAVRKCFEKARNFAAIPCYADTIASLNGLVKSELAAQNIRIEQEALEAFVPLLQGDRRMARSEIDKLALYMGENTCVGFEDIKAVAAGAGAAGLDDIVFDTLGGRPQKADGGYQRALAGKITSHSILAALQRHLTRLHQAKSLMGAGQSANEAMGNLRPPVFIMQKTGFANHLHIWSELALARALSESLATEKRMKTTGAPAQAILGRLLLALSNYAQKRTR